MCVCVCVCVCADLAYYVLVPRLHLVRFAKFTLEACVERVGVQAFALTTPRPGGASDGACYRGDGRSCFGGGGG